MVKQKILSYLFKPKSQNEDSRRQEIILNTIIWFSIGAFLIINIIRVFDIISQPNDRGLPIFYTLAILTFFVFLLWLSRRGLISTAAWLLTGTYGLPMAYSFLIWGADLPAALLMSVLVITMSGVLLGSRWALINAALISLSLLILTQLQIKNIWPANAYWRTEPHEIGDAITYGSLMMISAAIAHLFAREIKRALNRARTSEIALRQERDLLEQRVADRTKQLRQVHSEKLTQLYRLAALGRLSSGIFHDLINPLTAISLNLEMIKDKSGQKLGGVESSLRQAIMATRKMEGLIASIKKQVKKEGGVTTCSVNEEIRDAVEILAYKARKAGVSIKIKVQEELKLPGCQVKLNQIIMNLLSNAIEASSESTRGNQSKDILISASTQNNNIEIRVSDSGNGIPKLDLPLIFQPFFSTKKNSEKSSNNLGLGLSSVKEIVEKHFGGKIAVYSQDGKGSEFVIELPKNNKDKKDGENSDQ